MQQLAIVHTEQISRRGEIKYFQIPLLGTIKKIIAVEASAFLFTEVSLPQPTPDPVVIPDPSPPPTTPVNNNCPNPGNAEFYAVTQISTANGINTQTFQVGPAVNPGFIYSCGVYSVVISVTAVDGDTPYSIANTLATAVNNTSLATWNQYGSNNQNYKPTANAYNDVIVLTVDNQHAFFASGQGSCTGAPPPPPPPPPGPILLQYDPLFIISNNEKAGTLSLQSPNATDIFFQYEAYREDKNIGYGDYTMSGEMIGEWLKGKKRFATEVLIQTESPILEAYYKDVWGDFYNKDLNYQLNIIIWYEKQSL
jgi:hypothetical protein